MSHVMWNKLAYVIGCAFGKFYKRDFSRHWPTKSTPVSTV